MGVDSDAWDREAVHQVGGDVKCVGTDSTATGGHYTERLRVPGQLR